MSAALRLEGVSKRYRLGDGSTLRAADNVTLDIDARTRTAIMGPSGSGKSTLLHLIGAIDKPDAGRITVGDTEITTLTRRRLADYRGSVGFVFQQFHLISAVTVADNVSAPLVGRCSTSERRQRVREVLEAVGLEHRVDARPGQLSGGQQQRVAIARALVVRPALILADEPTGNLDSATAEEILSLLARVQREFSATLLIATHDHAIAAICDEIVHVHDGRVTRDDVSATEARP